MRPKTKNTNVAESELTDDDLGPILPNVPPAASLSAVDGLEKLLPAFCARLAKRDRRRRESDREDLCDAYECASSIRSNENLFARFVEMPLIKALPRQPKTTDHVLRSLLQACYDAHYASACWNRVKKLWNGSATIQTVRRDLEQHGISGRAQTIRLSISDPAAKFAKLEEGTAVGILMYATFERAGQLVDCELIDVYGE